jgi:hypothetical protein
MDIRTQFEEEKKLRYQKKTRIKLPKDGVIPGLYFGIVFLFPAIVGYYFFIPLANHFFKEDIVAKIKIFSSIFSLATIALGVCLELKQPFSTTSVKQEIKGKVLRWLTLLVMSVYVSLMVFLLIFSITNPEEMALFFNSIFH